jgi:hypothetical protein
MGVLPFPCHPLTTPFSVSSNDEFGARFSAAEVELELHAGDSIRRIRHITKLLVAALK